MSNTPILNYPFSFANPDALHTGVESSTGETPSFSYQNYATSSQHVPPRRTSQPDPTMILEAPKHYGNPYFAASVGSQAIALLNQVALMQSNISYKVERFQIRMIFETFELGVLEASFEKDRVHAEIKKRMAAIDGAMVQAIIATAMTATMLAFTAGSKLYDGLKSPDATSARATQTSTVDTPVAPPVQPTPTKPLPDSAAQVPAPSGGITNGSTPTTTVPAPGSTTTSPTGAAAPTTGTNASTPPSGTGGQGTRDATGTTADEPDAGSAKLTSSGVDTLSPVGNRNTIQQVESRISSQTSTTEVAPASQAAVQVAKSGGDQPPPRTPTEPEIAPPTSNQQVRNPEGLPVIENTGNNNPSQTTRPPQKTDTDSLSRTEVPDSSAPTGAPKDAAGTQASATGAKAQSKEPDLEDIPLDPESSQAMRWDQAMVELLPSISRSVSQIGASTGTILRAKGEIEYYAAASEIEKRQSAARDFKDLLKMETKLFQDAVSDINQLIEESIEAIKQIARQTTKMTDISPL